MGRTKKRLEKDLIQQYTAVAKAAQTAEVVYRQVLQALDNALQQAQKQVENAHQQKVRQLTSSFEQQRRTLLQTLTAHIQRVGMPAAPWNAGTWATHALPAQGIPPTFLRLGELILPLAKSHGVTAPALLPLVGHRHVLVSFEGQRVSAAAGLLESLAWRIVAFSPPNTFQFVLLDPLDRGSNFASLLKLPQEVRGPKIWCDEQDIEAALRQLAGDIEEVIQRRLLNTYKDLQAYNAANPDVAVPYRFLLFVGFPKGFTAKAADLLFSIARTGRRAGCYILGGVVRGATPPHGFDFGAFMNMASYLSLQPDGRLKWNDPAFEKIRVQPDPPPPQPIIEHLASSVAAALKSASNELPFRQIAVRKAFWWQADSTNGLEVPIGIDESGALAHVVIGRGVTHHVLVGGATGSGKTNLLHLLILMLSTKYSPDEVQLYLVDFKEGVEFQDYVTHALPHAQAVVLEAEREFGLSVLQHLVQEMERRSRLFKAAKVADLPAYRQRTGKKMPRVLLIMDEYVVLFSEDDRLAFEAGEALGALVMRGRSFGIHVLLSAQRPASTFLSMSHIKSQMGLRIALKCRPEDSVLILGEGNERAARLSQIGQACITDDPDRIDATVQVRIARVSPDERSLYLRGLQQFAQIKHFSRQAPMIVFRREAPAVWVNNPTVAARLHSSSSASPLSPTFWLGSPLRIADDVAVNLEREHTANLVIVGSDEHLALRILLASLLGLLLTTPAQRSFFHIMGTLGPHQPATSLFEAVQQNLPHVALHTWSKAVEATTTLVEELDRRLAALPALPEHTIFLFIAGLHQWREARGSSPYAPSETGEHLAKIVEHGPAVGIHTLMWVDRLASIGNVTGGTPYDVLLQFRHRVALQMGSEDSVNLLGGPYATRLGSERAYYRDERWPAEVLEKFKPYALPSSADVQALLAAVGQI